MTGSTTQSGQAPSPPAGDTGTAAAAGDTTTTVLGGDAAPAAKTGDAAAAAGAKPDGAAAANADGAKPGEPAKPGDPKTPEQYAAFTMPQGVELDAKAVTAFTPVLRELNLSQDQAQKLVNVQATLMQEQATAFGEQLKDANFALEQAGNCLTHATEAWSKALKADSEIGGKNYDASIQTAQRAIARFGSPELKTLLNRTGLGNHPEIVRFALKVGHLVQEDKTDLGSATGGGGRKSSEEVFYAPKSA